MFHGETLSDLLVDHILILLGALLLDITVGDPKEGSLLEKFHPVVWMGALIACMDRLLPRGNPSRELAGGVLMLIVVSSVFFLPAFLLYPLREATRLGYLVASVLLLKASYTVRGLRDFVLDTLQDAPAEKRRKVAKIVSRDTGSLNEGELNSAAIESAAENLTDSVVSPLLFFAVLGVPGALLYRAVNTLDAMVGYTTDGYRHIGKPAALVDRAFNVLPEMVASWLILLVSHRWQRPPTGTWPRTIGAMSQALGVNLRKPGVYDVSPDWHLPNAHHVRAAVRIATVSSILTVLLTAALIYLLHLGGWTWLSHDIPTGI